VSKRRLTVGAVVAAVGYFAVLPAFWFWMPPSATANLPPEWSYNQDMPVSVVVSSWHANYKVTEVRFVADPQKTQLKDVRTPLYPVLLLNEKPPRYWSRLTLNPLTFPTKRRLELTLPLQSLAGEGKVGPGTVVGNIDVEIAHVGAVNQHSGGAGGEMSQNSRSRIPFELVLH
jgi:hypothetical protein